MSCKKVTKENKILLAMPVHNERQYISEVLDRVSHYVGKYIDNVLVIDDGSKDGSKVLLAQRPEILFMSYPCNRGYGQTIIDAFHLAHCHGYDWVITMDCDLQHEPECLPVFVDAIESQEADIISGSRYMDGALRNSCPPADRRKINKAVTEMLNERLGLELTDAFCGFKAYRVNSLEKLDWTEIGYAFPLEFWARAWKAGLRVKEIPVSLIYHDPNRHFGGELDDARTRLEHYKEVFEQVMRQVGSNGK